MKVLKRPNRSGSVKMVRSKLGSSANTRVVNIVNGVADTKSIRPPISKEGNQAKPHPLSDVLGTFGGEAWEEFRATLLRLRQADAEDDSIE